MRREAAAPVVAQQVDAVVRGQQQVGPVVVVEVAGGDAAAGHERRTELQQREAPVVRQPEFSGLDAGESLALRPARTVLEEPDGDAALGQEGLQGQRASRGRSRA